MWRVELVSDAAVYIDKKQNKLTLSGERNKMCSQLFTKSFDAVVDAFFFLFFILL